MFILGHGGYVFKEKGYVKVTTCGITLEGDESRLLGHGV